MDQQNALSVLTRLAQRRPETGRWLEEVLCRNLEELAERAITVAVNVGDPIGEVLARCIRENASPALAQRLSALCEKSSFNRSIFLMEVALAATEKALAATRDAPNLDLEEREAEVARLNFMLREPSIYPAD